METLQKAANCAEAGDIPNGYKAYKAPFESSAFDELWDKVGTNAAANLSKFEIREDLHMHHSKFQIAIDMEVERIRKRGLERATRWESFVAEVEVKLQAKVLHLESFTSKVLAPDGVLSSPGDVAAQAAILHNRSCVSNEATRRAQELKDNEKAIESQKKAKELAANRTPEELLKSMVLEVASGPKMGCPGGQLRGKIEKTKPPRRRACRRTRTRATRRARAETARRAKEKAKAPKTKRVEAKAKAWAKARERAAKTRAGVCRRASESGAEMDAAGH